MGCETGQLWNKGNFKAPVNLCFGGEVVLGSNHAVAVKLLEFLQHAYRKHTVLNLMKWIRPKRFKRVPGVECFCAKSYLKCDPLYFFAGGDYVWISPVAFNAHQFSDCRRANNSLSSEASVEVRVAAVAPTQSPGVGFANRSRYRAASIWADIDSTISISICSRAIVGQLEQIGESSKR